MLLMRIYLEVMSYNFFSKAKGDKASEQNLSRWKRLWLSVSKGTKLRFSHRLGSTSSQRSKKTKD